MSDERVMILADGHPGQLRITLETGLLAVVDADEEARLAGARLGHAPSEASEGVCANRPHDTSVTVHRVMTVCFSPL